MVRAALIVATLAATAATAQEATDSFRLSDPVIFTTSSPIPTGDITTTPFSRVWTTIFTVASKA